MSSENRKIPVKSTSFSYWQHLNALHPFIQARLLSNIRKFLHDLDQAVLRGQAMAREHHASCISVTKEGVTIMSQAELLSTDIDLDQSLDSQP